MRKQKMRLRLRGPKARKTALPNKQEELQNRLKTMAAKRAKLTEELRAIDGKMQGIAQVNQAGMLAHYALFAVILGNLIQDVNKKHIEKQLEKLGDKELDYTGKLEQLKLFEKNSKDISDLSKKIEGMDDEQKQTFTPQLGELTLIRDKIAEKLGLNDDEYKSLTKTFDEHHHSLAANKEIDQSPFEAIKKEKKSKQVSVV